MSESVSSPRQGSDGRFDLLHVAPRQHLGTPRFLCLDDLPGNSRFAGETSLSWVTSQRGQSFLWGPRAHHPFTPTAVAVTLSSSNPKSPASGSRGPGDDDTGPTHVMQDNPPSPEPQLPLKSPFLPRQGTANVLGQRHLWGVSVLPTGLNGQPSLFRTGVWETSLF